MNRVRIEWLNTKIGIFRIHIDPDFIPGPWSWSCVVQVLSPELVKIHNSVGAPNLEQLRLIKRYLLNEGYSGVTWTRYRKGKPTKVFICNC